MVTSAPPSAGPPHAAADTRAAAMMEASLQVLVLLNLVQVAAGFLDAHPSPPDAMQPLIAATAALGVGSLALVRRSVPAGFVLGILFSTVSMIGMGPHKLFLADGGAVAPVALLGFAAEVTFIVLATRHLRVRP